MIIYFSVLPFFKDSKGVFKKSHAENCILNMVVHSKKRFWDAPIILFIIFSLTIGMALNSCGVNNDSALDMEGLVIEILHPSGDEFSFMEGDAKKSHMPYPLNYGILATGSDSCEVFVYSIRAEREESVGINPVIELTFIDNTAQKHCVIIALPVNKELRFSQGDSNLSLEQLYAIEHLIEFWYANKYGLNGARLVSKKQVSMKDYQFTQTVN